MTAAPDESAAALDDLLPPDGSGYRYKQIEHLAPFAGFEAEGYDDSDDSVWADGQAPFGSAPSGGASGCGLTRATEWAPGTDLLVRHRFTVPAGTEAVEVRVAVDNDVSVWVNGHNVSRGFVHGDGCATADNAGPFRVEAADLHVGAENVLAVRAEDRGGEAYLNLAVTAVGPESQSNLSVAAAAANPASGAPGDPVAVSWTTRNPTSFAATAPWEDAVYFSADAFFDPGTDEKLGSVGHASDLLGGEQYSSGLDVAVPSMQAGSYYLFVHTDDGLAFPESTEVDNIFAVPFNVESPAPQPNLDVTSLAAPASVRNGRAFTVDWQVTNQGSAPANPTWIDKLYLSPDELLDPGDVELASKARATALGAGESYAESTGVTLTDAAAGPQFLILKTDDGGSVDESNEDDNTASFGATVLAELTVAGGPDWVWRTGRELVFDITVNGSSGAHTCAWQFGDSTPESSSCEFRHTYATPGTYTARVSVTDGEPVAAAGQDEVRIEVLLTEDPGGGTGTGSGVGATGSDVTYTVDADFDKGTLLNVNHDAVHDQLQLNSEARPFPFVNVAASGRGTVVRIDAGTGVIVGEYPTAPDNRPKNPSRTTVDRRGNVWVANRDEDGISGGENKGSVARIGLVIGGTRVDADGQPNANGEYVQDWNPASTCVDRDGDGRLRTSAGLNHVLAWPNTGDVDSDGGVTTAEDECLIDYVRVSGTNVRTIAVDPASTDGDVWVGGYTETDHEKLDGTTGDPIEGTRFNLPCGGYGGLVDGNGVLWSARYGGELLRYDTGRKEGACLAGRGDYGIALDPDPAKGHIWHGYYCCEAVLKLDAAGNEVARYGHGFGLAKGVAVDLAGNVWVAHSESGSDVGRLRTEDGLLVGNVDLQPRDLAPGSGPTGVAVDSVGKVWVTNRNTHNVQRIDPAIGPILAGGLARGWVDLTVDLPANADPYNYSDMTGHVLASTSPQGSWSVVQDGGVAGTRWGTVTWNGAAPAGTELLVEARAADERSALGAFTTVANGELVDPVLRGRYIEVRVTLKRNADVVDSPVLHDLRIQAAPEEEPNLAVGSPAANPTSGAPGHPVAVSWRTRNTSSVTAIAPWADAVYFSTNDSLDLASDQKLTTVGHASDLLAGGEYSAAADVAVPSALAGNYFLLVRTDDGLALAESSEADNVFAIPFAVVAQVGGDSVVNTIADHDDGSCLPLSSGDCTLREAILRANAPPAAHNTISFDIPTADKTIRPASALPAVTDRVTIDGYTQPGALANTSLNASNANILVALDGTNAGAAVNGLRFTVGSNTVRGLAIGNFAGAGIELATGSGNEILGNFLGTNASGNAAAGNGTGVLVRTAANRIGEPVPADRNVISGNGDGVRLSGAGAGFNAVKGNLIGTDMSGLLAVGNSVGVNIDGAGSNSVGGSSGSSRNVISGNGTGFRISGSGPSLMVNNVEFNYIGTNVNGTGALGNGRGGEISGGAGNTVFTNVISGNTLDGVKLGAGASQNGVSGNIIGLNSAGSFPLSNLDAGVWIQNGSDNHVGGNTISGNNDQGVRILGGGQNRIDSNRIGTNPTATTVYGNGTAGIDVFDSPGNRIETNVLSGNRTRGLVIVGTASTGNVVRGNFVGTNNLGAALGNASGGVQITGGASNNTIGGDGAAVAERNVIAFNGSDATGAGVEVFTGERNSILGNSIHSNTKLGIDLSADGVTPNDAGDADPGANGLQNFPVLQGATTALVSGVVDSTPGTDLRLEFFSSTTCDPSGNGEGQTFRGRQTVTTDAAGHASYSVSLPGISLGSQVTATATGPDGTSEFGSCLAVGAEVPRISVDDVAEPEGDEGTKAFRFTVTRNSGAGSSGFHFETIAGSAQAGSDYVAQSGDRTFADGQTELTIDVLVNGDRTFELDEGFVVRLTGADNASFAKAEGSGLIRNDDGVPRFSIDDVSELEGPAGETNEFVFTITKEGETALDASVQFATHDVSALEPGDYTQAAGSRTFLPNETSKQVTVTVNGDGEVEPDETFTVDLESPTGADLLDGTGVGTIRNDDVDVCTPTTRTLSNGDPAVTDGALRIPVDGLGAAGDDSAGTALYNPPGELAAKRTLFFGGLYASNRDEFLADCVSGTSAVVAESSSSLTTSAQVGDLGLVLTQSVAAPAADGSSRLTQRYAFTNPSASPQPLVLAHLFDADLSFLNSRFRDGMVATSDGSELKILDTADMSVANPYVAAKGDLDGDGSADAFTGQPYDYRTVVVQQDGIHPDDAGVISGDDDGDGRADSEQDFSGVRESRLTLQPGQTRTLTIVLTFGLERANRGPQAHDDLYVTDEDVALTRPATGVLGNDDDPDGDGLTAVLADGPSGGELTLNPDGSFTYTPAPGFNGTDTFVYRAYDGKAFSDFAVVTIRVRPRLEVVGVERDEGTAAATTPFDFVVRLTGPALEPVTVDFTTVPGAAAAVADFQTRTGTLTFTPGGPQEQTITIQVVADALDEFDEEFSLELRNENGARYRNDRGTGLIRDDDDPVELEIGDVTVGEGNAGLTPARFKLALSRPSGKPVTVPYATVDGSAVAVSDYQAASGLVAFAPGETVATVAVNVVGDTVVEPSEQFFVNLDAADNATVVDAQGVGTIRNDDSAVILPPLPPAGADCGHPNAIRGTEGADSLLGTPGDDIICGGAGVDIIRGLGGNDVIFGGRHGDRILGGDGNDMIYGEGDADTIDGEAGNDVLAGGGGDDRLRPGTGDDEVVGGPGRDTADYAAAAGPVDVDLVAGIATGDGRDTVAQAESVQGSPRADTLMGDELANDLFGGAGPDEINGRGGNDTIFGQLGDDELFAGAGPDNRLIGGVGSDFCQLSPGGGIVILCERGAAGQAVQTTAAPVSFASSFTTSNQVKSKTITVSPSTGSVQLVSTWANPATALGATVEPVDRARPRKPARVPVKTTRGAGYLVVEARLPAKLRGAKKPWRLRVKLRPTRLGGATAVATTVVQKRRR